MWVGGECRGRRASNLHCISLRTFSALHEVPAVRDRVCVCEGACAVGAAPVPYTCTCTYTDRLKHFCAAPVHARAQYRWRRSGRPGVACVNVHVHVRARARAHVHELDVGRRAQIVDCGVVNREFGHMPRARQGQACHVPMKMAS